MSSFLETYGVAIFTLVLVAILIAFAGPLWIKIKNATTDKVCQTEQIGKDEITVATGGTVEPAEAVDKVYCIYYDDGETTISQNEIEPEAGRTVVKKGFYERPSDCASEMTTARFVGAVKPKNCEYWFLLCKKLTEIKNIQNLYTNECTNMGSMFCNCENLISLDVSGFDTSKVTKMSFMFSSCRNLTSLDVNGFNTGNVTAMKSMFYGCQNLISLDLSGWNTEKVTTMRSMFHTCTNLTSLDVSGWNTGNVTSMFDMFACCQKLTNLNINGLDTSKVESMYQMFYGCQNLISLDLSGWNTSKVESMNSMFAGCNNLKSITASQTVKDKILNTESNTNVPSSVTWIIK